MPKHDHSGSCALAVVRRLLLKAIAAGYRSISKQEVWASSCHVRRALGTPKWCVGVDPPPNSVLTLIDDLCGHLAQAVADGLLGELPEAGLQEAADGTRPESIAS